MFPRREGDDDDYYPDPTTVPSYATATTFEISITPSTAFGRAYSSTQTDEYGFSTVTSVSQDESSKTSVPAAAFTSVPFGPDDNGFWDNFSQGVKAAIIISIIIGFFSVIIASIWFCCGRPRKRRRRERESTRLDGERERAAARNVVPGGSVERLPVPLQPIHSRDGLPPRGGHDGVTRDASRVGVGRQVSVRGDAPPRYEEVVPPAHQRVAGGLRVNTEEEDGMGVVADGKTPLSEIPFEDVVLETARSEGSSSRDFGERHAQGGGDTRGHTNA